MTREEAIHEVCSIVSLAKHAVNDWSTPNDGFCDECMMYTSSFANDGITIEWVRQAVMEKIKRDGYKFPEKDFDPKSGLAWTDIVVTITNPGGSALQVGEKISADKFFAYRDTCIAMGRMMPEAEESL